MAELQLPEAQINGGAVVGSTENVSIKRQRRPSVRLGEIGDQANDSTANQRTKQWKFPMKDSSKGRRTRGLMYSGGGDFPDTLDGDDREVSNLEAVAIGSWRVKDSKSKRGLSKRIRSNWVSKVDNGGGVGGGEGDEKFSCGEDVLDDGFRDFYPQAS